MPPRLRSSAIDPDNVQQTTTALQHTIVSEYDGDLEAGNNGDTVILSNSTRKAEKKGQHSEDSNPEYDQESTISGLPEVTISPPGGLFRRAFGYILGGTPRTSRHQPGANDKSSTLLDASEIGATKLTEVNGEEPAEESIAIAKEHEQQDLGAMPATAEPEQLSLGEPEAHGTPLRSTEETSVSGDTQRVPNPTLNKPEKSKQPVHYVDNSFHYSKPRGNNTIQRDIYDSPTPEPEEKISPKAKKTGKQRAQAPKRKNTKATKTNTPAKKSAAVPESDDKIPEFEVVVPSKRRGRPPKSARQGKTDEASVEAKEFHKPTTTSTISEAAAEVPAGNPQEFVPETRKRRGRPARTSKVEDPKSSTNFSKIDRVIDPTLESAPPRRIRKPAKASNESPVLGETEEWQGHDEDQPGRTIQADMEEYLGQQEFSQRSASRPTTSKKRRNDQSPRIPNKRAKTSDSSFEPDEESESDDKGLPQSQIVVTSKKKPRSLVLQVAAAEESARQKRKVAKVKERDWQQAERDAERDVQQAKRAFQKADREAEDAEQDAEHLRARLERAREDAVAREREAKGLPPLRSKQHMKDPFDEEEDFESGIERVGGLLGTKNVSHKAVPFSDEEKNQLVLGLWKEENAGKFFNFYF